MVDDGSLMQGLSTKSTTRLGLVNVERDKDNDNKLYKSGSVSVDNSRR
jgi:hypothetical protein